MTLQDLEQLCKTEQKKLSNGERRLRELMASDPITTTTNSRGAIIGYNWQKPSPGQPPQRVVNWLAQFQKPVEKKELTLF